MNGQDVMRVYGRDDGNNWNHYDHEKKMAQRTIGALASLTNAGPWNKYGGMDTTELRDKLSGAWRSVVLDLQNALQTEKGKDPDLERERLVALRIFLPHAFAYGPDKFRENPDLAKIIDTGVLAQTPDDNGQPGRILGSVKHFWNDYYQWGCDALGASVPAPLLPAFCEGLLEFGVKADFGHDFTTRGERQKDHVLKLLNSDSVRNRVGKFQGAAAVPYIQEAIERVKQPEPQQADPPENLTSGLSGEGFTDKYNKQFRSHVGPHL